MLYGYSLTLLQDLEEFANGSGDDGFVVFTLGSMVANMPEDEAKLFFEAFRQIPQRVIGLLMDLSYTVKKQWCWKKKKIVISLRCCGDTPDLHQQTHPRMSE